MGQRPTCSHLIVKRSHPLNNGLMSQSGRLIRMHHNLIISLASPTETPIRKVNPAKLTNPPRMGAITGNRTDVTTNSDKNINAIIGNLTPSSVRRKTVSETTAGPTADRFRKLATKAASPC